MPYKKILKHCGINRFWMVLLLVIVLAVSIVGCTCSEQLEAPVILDQQSSLMLYGADPLTLDPARSNEMLSLEYLIQIYGGLVKFGEDLDPAPDIAERWNVSADGCTYTFYLRNDVLFHDGTPVVASDVKYSWERACWPETGSVTASTYLSDIVGADDVLDGLTREISGIEVQDDYTLRVTLDSPKSYFLAKLTYPVTFVLNRNSVESGSEWWKTPNGTGPYKLAQWDEGSLMVLQKNEDYYGQKASIDFVTFLIWSGRPMNMYETGDIDVTSVSVTYIDKIMDESGPFYADVEEFPELSLSYIGFNCNEPPFDDVNVRRAFCCAVDKEKIRSLVFRNMVECADGILPPGMPGYNPDVEGWRFDVERAKALIAESSYGSVENLPPIVLTTEGWSNSINQSLESIIYQWEENLGVDITVRQLEPEVYYYNLDSELDNMFDMGWVADYPHPQNFLELLFGPDAPNNYGGYYNAEVDALLQLAGIEQDNEKSLALYRQAEQIMVDEAVCLPLWFGENYLLIRPYVQGYEPNALGMTMLNEVELVGK